MVPGLPELWSETTGDPRVVVAVLGGPLDWGHRSLAGARLNVIEAAASAAPDPNRPATRHGTTVASLIFGRRAGRLGPRDGAGLPRIDRAYLRRLRFRQRHSRRARS